MAIVKDFPRGGRKPNVQTFKKPSFTLFGKKPDKKRKKTKPIHKNKDETKQRTEGKSNIPEASDEFKSLSAELLSVKTIAEGMVILGRVHSIESMKINVSLPGRLPGRVFADSISLPYSDLIQRVSAENSVDEYVTLEDLFHIGDYVVVKVISLKTNESQFEIKLSLMPQDVQSEMKSSQLNDNIMIVAAVQSVEDHGYVMDCGIPHARAFLPLKHCENSLAVGQVVMCVIQKSVIEDGFATITLSTKAKKMQEIHDHDALKDIIPGSKIKLTITKVLSDGLEVSFAGDCVGYVNHVNLRKPFDRPSNYNVGDDIQGLALYTIPTSKFMYFTLKEMNDVEEVDLKPGEIVDAVIYKVTRQGITLKLSKTTRGFVSHNRIDPNRTETPMSTRKCRVITYDYMEQSYICTLESKAIAEKYFCLNDVQPGDIIRLASITEITPKGVKVQFGALNGFVTNLQLADVPMSSTVISKKFKVGQKIKQLRILFKDVSLKRIFLTAKKALIDTQLPILSDYNTLKVNSQHDGVITTIKPHQYMLVNFFGNVRGYIPANETNCDSNFDQFFFLGQVVKCRVVKFDKPTQKLTVSLRNINKSPKVPVGTVLSKVRVVNVNPMGLDVVSAVEGSKNNAKLPSGVVPVMFLSENPYFNSQLLETYTPNEIYTDVVCVGRKDLTNIFSKRDFNAFKNGIPNIAEVKKDTLLRCSVREIKNNFVYLSSPIEEFKGQIMVNFNDFPKNTNPDVLLKINQLVIGRVLKVDFERKVIECTLKLSKVWDYDLNDGLDLLKTYLKDSEAVKESIIGFKKISTVNIGDRVETEITSVTDSGLLVFEMLGNVNGVVLKDHIPKNASFKVGDKIDGRVLWIDYALNCVFVTLNKQLIHEIGQFDNTFKKTRALEIPHAKMLRAKIILVRPDFAIACLRGSGKHCLVFLPIKEHINNFFPSSVDYNLGEVVKVNVHGKIDNKYFLGLLKSRVKEVNKLVKLTKRREMRKLMDKLAVEKEKSTGTREKKRKLNVQDDGQGEHFDPENKINTNNKKNIIKKRKIEDKIVEETNFDNEEREKLKNNQEMLKEVEKPIEINSPEPADGPVLPGVDVFWDLNLDSLKELDKGHQSSDSENDEPAPVEKKRRKTAQDLLEEEERLRQVEERIADPNAIPNTVEQFDRLVTANPDDHLTWIKYIVWHLESTETDKARAVARRALATISFREERAKFNVWIVLLNIENRFGTYETFTTVLKEMAREQDELAAYTKALQILAESGKVREFDDLLQVCVRRHKESFDMWLNAVTGLFQLRLVEKARGHLTRALASLENKQHVDFIVQFALLEAKNGDNERAEVLFEQVITSYPKRVDVWCSYVDLLVKSNRIDVARKVLERSISLTLPAKKMKTLFKKFIDFEKAHGSPEAVERVKQMAVDYATKV